MQWGAAESGMDIAEYTIEQNWSATATTSTPSGASCSSASSECWSGAPAANTSTACAASASRPAGIPDFRRLSDMLDRATGWRIVAVPGLVPDDVFFALLAERRFPVDLLHPPPRPARLPAGAGRLPRHLRPRAAADEPGLRRLHAGLRQGRARRRCGSAHLEQLARLYWYTVEFGLIATQEGCASTARASSPRRANSIYCLDDPRPQPRAVRPPPHHADAVPHRRYQETYFVIDDFDQLFDATRPDFAPIYPEIAGLPEIAAGRGAAGRTAAGRKRSWAKAAPQPMAQKERAAR